MKENRQILVSEQYLEALEKIAKLAIPASRWMRSTISTYALQDALIELASFDRLGPRFDANELLGRFKKRRKPNNLPRATR